ncbi:fumarylacetoacetate hydrolase family protein [Deinococcus rubellus]|uniref:Fumarylacetoacetate hydrolase family protein n=1 Tax=Deinococcus rubellus TaxID=1889240 RepID=A0ABY5YIG3_9DEIO|nr:fumarylacetoacetate hydrolase family protein [Deinococcus rubellus]UWX64905.1 fumarylacetoacetate hydrolase family protein [Deinococcus rubellus]
MKLIRFRDGAGVRWGRLEGEQIQVTLGMGGEVSGETALLGSVQVLAPAEPSKIVCVGRNYIDHIKELGNDTGELPREPGLFLKAANTLAENSGNVSYPEWSENFHFEGELALVISQTARNLTPVEVPAAILGYTCALDLTARDKQKTDLQWFRAKAADRFCPLGPTLETQFDPTDVTLRTLVNGETKQDSRTSFMIFDVVQILTYVTRYVTLERGDVVLTGTPSGVGPLERGDTLRVEIDGLDALTTHIV